jgi:virginiamycin B lyase
MSPGRPGSAPESHPTNDNDPARHGLDDRFLPSMDPRYAQLMRALLAVCLSLITVAACASGASPAAESTAPTTTPQPAPSAALTSTAAPAFELTEFPVSAGSHPHDVAPAADGGVWYTGQQNGTLGHLDPATRSLREVRLGAGSAPHGVIVGPDGAAWITDGGLNGIVRVDPATQDIKVYRLPPNRPNANLNTATFDRDGVLWFTGQSGVYGRLDPAQGAVEVFDAPRGPGPYGITTTPSGDVWYASLAASYIARIDRPTRIATVFEPPTKGQGARRVWSDSRGRIWVAEWNAGQVAMLDPASRTWREWRLPGSRPQAYAVYVDERDAVWLTDFGGNAIVRFDPQSETFTSLALPAPNGSVRQLLGRPGQVWGAESAADKLVVIR